MKIKIKLYNDWVVFKSKKEAEEKLLEYMMCSDGAERDRYTHAYLSIKNGRKEINTDDELY